MRALPLLEREQAEAEHDLGAESDSVNLLDDLDGLASRLQKSLASRNALDSFLVAAGMNQVAEDYLHRDLLLLARVEANLRRLPSGMRVVARVVVESARRAGLRMRDVSPTERSARQWQSELAKLTQVFADQVAGVEAEFADDELNIRASNVLATLPSLPGRLRHLILRMPTCFQSLDQRPLDCGALVKLFADRWPERSRVVSVLGLRTSGSYLAPLIVAYLKRRGYVDATAWTVRPGQDSHRDERNVIRALVDSDALLVVIDDPPKTGKSLAAAANGLELSGLARERIVMLAPLTGPSSAVPTILHGYQTVALRWGQWSVHDRLRPDVVMLDLEHLLVGRDVIVRGRAGDRRPVTVGEVTSVRRLHEPPIGDLKAGSPVRRHVRALFEVGLRDVAGREVRHHVYAKGVGLGYFGRHSLTVARALEGFVPETYGLRDGLLFREWVTEGARVRWPASTPEISERVADYVLARRANLAVANDVSERLVGLNPVWQRVADILAASFGDGRSLVRPIAHRAARRLLRVESPSVIDGSMAVCQWFRDPRSKERFFKVDYDERAYSNQDTVVDQLYSFDAVFDLAAAAADLQLSCIGDSGVELAARLRARFELTAGAVGEERWLLYQLLVLKSYRQFLESMRSELDPSTYLELASDTLPVLQPGALADEVDRLRGLMSSLDQRYLQRQFLADLTHPEHGLPCAIDLDGVLETDRLGYSSVTPLGALILRSLVAHGYQPILATGRSVGEVRDRCRAFGLAGGVAEYGAAFYDRRADRVHELLTADDCHQLQQLRAACAAVGNVHQASWYRRAVRASLISDGARHPLPDPMVRAVVEECGLTGRVRAVHGWAQTDLMVDGVDKGSGLRALLEHLELSRSKGAPRPLAFAAGDGAEDIPMLRMAEVRVAPANAEPSVRAEGTLVMRGRHQAGLAQGVRLLIGHAPGGCARCRPAPVAGDARILLTALRAQEDGRMRKLWQAGQLATQLVAR